MAYVETTLRPLIHGLFVEEVETYGPLTATEHQFLFRANGILAVARWIPDGSTVSTHFTDERYG